MTKNERQRLNQIRDRFQLKATKRLTDVDFLYVLVLRENKRYKLEKAAHETTGDRRIIDMLFIGLVGMALGFMIVGFFS